ncbi:MAG TPA: diguanylate cyclase [Steroidobacteraceae bacterium]|nr:diguanylate cyclase [Steroidobacteraceae bacterium]
MEAAIEASACIVALRDEGPPRGEGERLAALRRLALLDSPPNEAFDAVTRLAAGSLRAPFAMISLVDEHRIWCKSRHGLEGSEFARRGSFCNEVVSAHQPLIVRDAAQDPRFELNPWVRGSNRVRSYVGVPLCTRDRQVVGVFAVMDRDVRRFGELDLATLGEFARIVEELIAARETASRAGVLQYAMEREKLFRETFEQAAVGIVHTALSGAILRINQRACTLLGYPATKLRDLTFQDLTHPEDLPRNVQEFKRLLAGDIDRYRLEQRLKLNDGSFLWCLVSVALKRSSRQPDYGIVVIEDISDLKRAQSEAQSARDALKDKVDLQARRLKESQEALQLEAQRTQEAERARTEAQAAVQSAQAKLTAESLTDPLTGLANRRSFGRRIAEAVQAPRATRKPFGLVLIDVDDFKQINNVFGHEAGDEVLAMLGRIIGAQLPTSSDVAARISGTEFAVLCVGDITEQTLHDVAERIRTQVNRESFTTAKGLVRFTASYGLALGLSDDAEWKTVYGRADAALYDAKKAGKDRISFGRSVSKGGSARLKALTLPPTGV